MNTDKHRSALLTRKSFASCQGFFSAGLLGAHASCVQGVRHPGHAGSVRSQGQNLRVLCVSAVRFFLVAAELLCVHPCSSVVSFILLPFAYFATTSDSVCFFSIFTAISGVTLR